MKITSCRDAHALRPLERPFFARDRCLTYQCEAADLRRLILEKSDGRINTAAFAAGLFRSAASQALRSIRPSHGSVLDAEVSLLPPEFLLPTHGPRETGLVVVLDLERYLCTLILADLGPMRLPLAKIKHVDSELSAALDVVLRTRPTHEPRPVENARSHAMEVFRIAKAALSAELANVQRAETLTAAIRPHRALGRPQVEYAPLALVALAFASAAMDRFVPPPSRPPPSSRPPMRW